MLMLFLAHPMPGLSKPRSSWICWWISSVSCSSRWICWRCVILTWSDSTPGTVCWKQLKHDACFKYSGSSMGSHSPTLMQSQESAGGAGEKALAAWAETVMALYYFFYLIESSLSKFNSKCELRSIRVAADWRCKVRRRYEATWWYFDALRWQASQWQLANSTYMLAHVVPSHQFFESYLHWFLYIYISIYTYKHINKDNVRFLMIWCSTIICKLMNESYLHKIAVVSLPPLPISNRSSQSTRPSAPRSSSPIPVNSAQRLAIVTHGKMRSLSKSKNPSDKPIWCNKNRFKIRFFGYIISAELLHLSTPVLPPCPLAPPLQGHRLPSPGRVVDDHIKWYLIIVCFWL